MSRDATTITAPHETTCPRLTLEPGMIGRLVHHRGGEIIVTACVFHYGRARCHAKKEAAIAATMPVRAICTMIAAIEDREIDNNDYHGTATAETTGKPHSISRLRGVNTSLDTA